MRASLRSLIVLGSLLSVACACSAPPNEPTVASAPPVTVSTPETTAPPTPTTAPTPEPSQAPTTQLPAATKTLFVHAQRVDCQGEGPMRCMQVRDSDKGEWTYFYDAIGGFDYQEGFFYELRVEVTHVANPPADGSSLEHTLVEVVSKKKAP